MHCTVATILFSYRRMCQRNKSFGFRTPQDTAGSLEMCLAVVLWCHAVELDLISHIMMTCTRHAGQSVTNEHSHAKSFRCYTSITYSYNITYVMNIAYSCFSITCSYFISTHISNTTRVSLNTGVMLWSPYRRTK